MPAGHDYMDAHDVNFASRSDYALPAKVSPRLKFGYVTPEAT